MVFFFSQAEESVPKLNELLLKLVRALPKGCFKRSFRPWWQAEGGESELAPILSTHVLMLRLHLLDIGVAYDK